MNRLLAYLAAACSIAAIVLLVTAAIMIIHNGGL